MSSQRPTLRLLLLGYYCYCYYYSIAPITTNAATLPTSTIATTFIILATIPITTITTIRTTAIITTTDTSDFTTTIPSTIQGLLMHVEGGLFSLLC